MHTREGRWEAREEGWRRRGCADVVRGAAGGEGRRDAGVEREVFGGVFVC